MIEERLEATLTNMGYRKISSNTPDIYLFYHIEETELSIISVVRTIKGSELTKEQYEHILEQIKNNFRGSYPHRIQLLSLILTDFPDRTKHLCTEQSEDNHWIIDMSAGRLMIYESQSNEFAGLRSRLEQLLEEEHDQNPTNIDETEEHYSSGMQGREVRQGYARMQSGTMSKYKLFTLMNTLLIVVNVIAFFIMHYTMIFGGESRMISKGALSWYFVKEEREYYRIVTSMFLHSDWDHLFNNMLVLLFVGDNLERAAGKLKYLFLYFGTGIIAGIASIGYNMWKENGQFLAGGSVFSIGASGAIFGIVGAMLFIVIINKGRLEDISTRQMALFVIFSLYGGIVNTQIDQAAHIGGFVAGIILAALIYRRPKKRMAAGQPLGAHE